ncbi:MAG: hypothetical protein ACPL4E_09480 [Thermoproteota archaeon]
MGEYFLTVCYKRGKALEREKELHAIAMRPAYVMDERFGTDEFEVLWRKGLRHMSTILATAYDLKFSKREGMKEVYEKLRRKVKVWVRSGNPWGFSNYVVTRVFWPCEILDLKEVQDEIKVLTSGPLLSMDNPEDRRLVEQATKRPSKELIDRNMDELNICANSTVDFLTKSAEFHHKYPKFRFWFYVEFD